MENTFENASKNSSSILNAFSKKFATKVNTVYINSLKREVNFREVSVNEQKTLSKTMIENENRKDIVYDTQCALINRLCLENDDKNIRTEAKEAAKAALPEAVADAGVDLQTPKGAAFVSKFTNDFVQNYIAERSFDVYNLTEFDRIRILMEIYQNNYTHEKIKYKCKECGAENEYVMDFSKIIDNFNSFNIEDQTYTLEDNKFVYNFVLNYPKVRNVSQFYKMYMKKYKGTSSKERDVLDSIGNVDYINLYIKRIEMVDKETGDKDVADLTFMTYEDIDTLISMFPQNVIFSEEDGVLKFIAKEFIEKINSVFQYEKCPHCGAEAPISIGGAADFL